MSDFVLPLCRDRMGGMKYGAPIHILGGRGCRGLSKLRLARLQALHELANRHMEGRNENALMTGRGGGLMFIISGLNWFPHWSFLVI